MNKSYVLLFIALVLTRLYGLTWGFPYLMHPDENNMISSILSLTCTNMSKECLNPHFFAYGQFPLYLTSFILTPYRYLSGLGYLQPQDVSFTLRLIAATSSILSGVILFKLLNSWFKQKKIALIGLAFFIFSPGLIQQAHFGTTESLLMFFLLCITYFSKRFSLQAFFVGLSVATKPSGVLFFIIPAMRIILDKKLTIKKKFVLLIKDLFLVVITTFIFSPHYFFSLSDFLSSLNYESSVATGSLKVFYTTQFSNTIPLLFQFTHILPVSIGILVLFLGVVGYFFFIKKDLALALSILFLFIYSCFLYTKWTRFIVIFLPYLIIASCYALDKLFTISKTDIQRSLVNTFCVIGIAYQLILGLSYMSIYTHEDTRVSATKWIAKNIPAGSKVLSESANVVELPLIGSEKYRFASLFLNTIDESNVQSSAALSALKSADYVIVPSRRVFANYSCYQPTTVLAGGVCEELKSRYPSINKYYQLLFDSQKFRLVYQSNELKDEFAEETWTVFDHPVVRIFKRIKEAGI